MGVVCCIERVNVEQVEYPSNDMYCEEINMQQIVPYNVPGARLGQLWTHSWMVLCPAASSHRSNMVRVVRQHSHVAKYRLYCCLPSPAKPRIEVMIPDTSRKKISNHVYKVRNSCLVCFPNSFQNGSFWLTGSNDPPFLYTNPQTKWSNRSVGVLETIAWLELCVLTQS